MKAVELRKKTIEELEAERINLLREMFNLRMQKASGQLTKNHEMKRARREIARLLTIKREKMRADV